MATQEGIMSLIYNKINDMIGAGNQLFTMQFPAQPLNYRMYQYDTSSNTSVLTKPFTIKENEFRLSDQLFDVSPITAGSNGEHLSVVYNTLINNFIPKLDYLVPFIRDRAGLGNFLEEDSGETDDKGKSLSRIELSKKLYQEYLEAKNQWNEDKNTKRDTLEQGYEQAKIAYETARDKGTSGAALDALRQTADDKAGWLDDYANWQGSYGMVRQEELNNLYNDVVVRGHIHEVMTILGYLNASSIAEELEVTKQKMRNSSRSSLDESMTIYPVQFQPNNWFKALTPNINPADLTMAQDSIQDQLMAKQKELSRAKTELAQMDLMDVKPEEITAAQAKVDTAQTKLKQAETDLTDKQGRAFTDLANALVKAFPASSVAEVATVERAAMFGFPLGSDQIAALTTAVTGVTATKTAQKDATESLADLQKLKAQRAQLDSHDWKFNKSSLQQRVQELAVEVDYYMGLLAGVQGAQGESSDTYLKKSPLVTDLITSANAAKVHITAFKAIAAIDLGGLSASTQLVTPPTDLAAFSEAAAATDDVNLQGLTTYLQGTVNPYLTTIQTALKLGIKLLGEAIDTEGKKPTGKDLPKISAWTTKQQELLDDQSKLEAAQTKLSNAAPPVLSAPQTEADAEVSGMFQDILIKSSQSTGSSSQTESASSSSSTWAVSAWFASASGQSSTSSSQSAQESAFFNQDIEIGFRVAKVSFDRGGWFNPSIFKMSNAFYHLAPMRVSGGLSIADVKTANPQTNDLQNKLSWKDSDTQDQPYVLPAFPVAMAIAKDITIKVKIAAGQSNSSKSVVEKATASGGGFLCFSASSGAASKSSAETTFHGATSDAYYIRIPGPQVIGYFLQFVAKDNSFPYSPTTTPIGEGKESEVIAAFNLYKNPNRLKQSDSNPVIPASSPASVATPVLTNKPPA